ncbi:MAG: chemotaxis protein CheB, partial [Candidatus Heimdallarchaeota archaeon]|nr:chemotaxis protein CheB [Candidatus Heimdallarchaeota archaeon]
LSGANSDGAKGAYNAQKNGAFTIIQDPDDASFSTMPLEAMKIFRPDRVFSVDDIISFLCSIHYN